LAERIAANAPLAVRYSKSVMKRAAEVPEAEGWAINAEAVGVVFTSADAMEGPVAFAEKRAPRWQGK
jgi:enoyl-CoA hydratase/carnithine racemase